MLATVLLLQLSFHTLHALSDHSEAVPTAHSDFDSQIGDAASHCGTCAQFLWQHLYFAPLLLVLTGLAIRSTTRISGALLPIGRSAATCLLRGPPETRS